MKEGFSRTAIRVFRSLVGADKVQDDDELSAPISIRIPKQLLAEIDAQADSISGSRYRSRHISNLLYLGANQFRAQDSVLRDLDPFHFAEVSRLNYIFDKHALSVSKVSQEMGYDSTELLSGYLNGRIRPEFSVLENLANKLMLNAEWLKNGVTQDGGEIVGNMLFTPYIVSAQYFTRNLGDLIQQVLNFQEHKIQTLRVIRNQAGSVLLNFDYGDHRYASIHYHVLSVKDTSSIGRSGEDDLALFAVLMRYLSKELNEFNVVSYTVDDERFELLRTGQANPEDVGLSSIHSPTDWVSALWSQHFLSNAVEADLWPGAKELFGYIQNSRDYELYSNDLMDGNMSQYAHIRHEYNDKFRG